MQKEHHYTRAVRGSCLNIALVSRNKKYFDKYAAPYSFLLQRVLIYLYFLHFFKNYKTHKSIYIVGIK